MSHILHMSNKCSVCSNICNIKKYYSKFIGTSSDDASYFCEICYNKEEQRDDTLIKFAIQNGENIINLVKHDCIIDFVNPSSNNPIIKHMNIYKVVSEVIDGVKEEFVMINLKEYNKYMINVVCSNKKITDNEILNKKQQQQDYQNAVEKRKIEAINERAQRELEKQKKIDAKIEIEIKINKFNNEKIKKEKEELREQYVEVFKVIKIQKLESVDFVKNIKFSHFILKMKIIYLIKKHIQETNDKKKEFVV